MMPQLADLAASLAPALEHATRAWREFGLAVAAAAQTVLPLSAQITVAPDDIPELALRAHACRLNMRRQWRKVSWRRLNRHDRAAAYWSWMAER